jgi:beta-lactamase class C
MRQKVTIAFLLVIILHVLAVCKVPEERETIAVVEMEHPTPSPFLEEFESLFTNMMTRSNTPGAAVAIVKGGEVVFLRGFGLKKLGEADSVDEHTVFRLASVSKGFTGVLGALLDYDETLELDDRLIEKVDSFDLKSEWHEDSLTIQHVLSQSTGLPYHAYTNLVEEGWERERLLDELAQVDFAGNAGEFYSYQNVSLGWFEVAAEEALDKDFADIVREKIFDPLEMEDASMTHEDFTSSSNIARPHLRVRRGWRTISISPDYYNVASAGGINASISDMSKWLLALMGNRQDVLPDTVLNTVFQPIVPTYVERKYFSRWRNLKEAHYGLGWRVLKRGNDDIFYHGGYVNGYRSEILINKTADVGICILMNAPSTFSYKAIPMFLDLYEKHRDPLEEPDEPLIGPVESL